MTADRQTVVVWSGGADSTMLLTEHAHESSAKTPVRAITVEDHHQLDSKFMKSQRMARKRYLAWAKKQGYHIDHGSLVISVESGDAWVQHAAGQYSLWVAHLAPYLPERCRLLFGYIAVDGFWHMKAEHEAALGTLQKLVRADWQIEYPYEWSKKYEVYRSLEGWKVPHDCWWSCEEPKKVWAPCGKCAKCKERKVGMADLAAYKADWSRPISAPKGRRPKKR